MESSLHWLSTILSLGAAVMAFYLVPISGRTGAWSLFSVAFILLSIERLGELTAHAGIFMSFDASGQGVISDILLTLMAACLSGGTFFIRHLFLERNKERLSLEQRLDELRRFREVAIGRELPMKELYEENQALKAQIGEPGK